MSKKQPRIPVGRSVRPVLPPAPNLEAIFAQAVKHHMAGQEAQAEALYRSILAVPPIQAEASYNIGLLYQSQGMAAAAAAAYRQAIGMRAEHVDAHCNLGSTLQDLGRQEEAVAAYHNAVALKPDHAMAYCNLGVALKGQGKLTEAVAAYARATAINPAYDFAYANLSAVLLEQGDAEGAIAACRRAIALNAKIPMAHFNLGTACKALNRLDEATEAFQAAIAVKPDFVEAHFSLAQVYLQQGRFEEGWREYEWRWRLKQYAWLKNIHGEITRPLWDGGELHGQTILIYAEQGLGDAIQYVRYLPFVKAKGGKIVLAVHPPLKRLFASLADITLTTLDEAPFPPFDVHCPLLSLPKLAETRGNDIPAAIPYLRAEPEQIQYWKRRTGITGLKVGLVWAGNPNQTGDHLRSPRLAAVRPLFDIPGIDFVALQLGAGRMDLATAPLPRHVIDLGERISDFSDTAAIMTCLDLVVTSCTAPLHLAGALGIPTWAMIPFSSHFLWQLGKDGSPWYPSLRLYRQARPGTDWSDVVERIARDLVPLVGEKRRMALSPAAG